MRTAGRHAPAHTQWMSDVFADSPTTAISPAGVSISRVFRSEQIHVVQARNEGDEVTERDAGASL